MSRASNFIDKFSRLYPDLDFSESVYDKGSRMMTIRCRKHGYFKKSSTNLHKGGCKRCGIERRSIARKVTFHDFVQRAINTHGDKFGYDEESFKNMNTKLRIKCHIHGWFMQTPSSHLLGKGCLRCKPIKMSKSFSEWKRESMEIHGEKFEYDESTYSSLSKKTKIKCPEHGWFWQIANSHKIGHGCRKCEAIGFKKSRFIDICLKNSGGLATIYLIKCNDGVESFYKIGVTTGSVFDRFKYSIPYEYSVVSRLISHASHVWDLEKNFQSKSIGCHYIPKIKFNGSIRECFTKAYFNGIWYE